MTVKSGNGVEPVAVMMNRWPSELTSNWKSLDVPTVRCQLFGRETLIDRIGETLSILVGQVFVQNAANRISLTALVEAQLEPGFGRECQ
ncbi:hypothetical protein HDF10_001296 [Edaphobacter lichenicola]|uniref:Uncharacterized protein n=1 Tax=Tunturiibacter lichenicola TaxID=2051959 RepID=A0A7W8N488_9BACT|nr:hypothetical protein [Edaphobacter lichenicola]